MQGATTKTRISVAALAAWVEFCCKRLAAACPAELRLLSCLCLERPRTDHATVVKAIQELSNDTQFWSKAFRLEPLKQPLDVVEPGDLADFLNGRHSTCPEELFGDMPKLIVQQTHGEFEATVNLLELADQIGWYELHADLCQASKPSADTLHKDTLL